MTSCLAEFKLGIHTLSYKGSHVSKGIVTFTTDFGTEDHFVGTMKGVVLGTNPDAAVIDICNNIKPFSILHGAITIAQAYHYYPAGTIHVVIVDPGVGTARRPIIADTGKYVFIGPDNGVLSLIFDRQERLTVRHVTAEHYFLQPVSATFHGRDIFAAIAGHVSRGVDLSKLGDPINDYVRLQIPQAQLDERRIAGHILLTDRFGNIITNIGRRMLSQFLATHSGSANIRIGSTVVNQFQTAYANGRPGELFGIIGSMGYLEIATNQGSAEHMTGTAAGDAVEVVG